MTTKKQSTSEQALEFLQQQKDFQEHQGIEQGKKALMRYRYKQHSSGLPVNDRGEILPLIKITLPDFIKVVVPSLTKKEQFQDLRTEVLGEIESEGIANMRKNKRLNDAMQASANLRKTLERNRLAKATNPHDLLQQVDNIVDGAVKEVKVSEKGHVPLSKVPHLLRELSGESARNTAENLASKIESNKKITKEDPVKILLKNRRAGQGLNRNVIIPTLEMVQKRKRSVVTKKPVRSKPLSTPALARTLKRKTTSLAAVREKCTIEGFEQLCSVADTMANAYIQSPSVGNALLDKYRQGFSQKRRGISNCLPAYAQKLASYDNVAEEIADDAKKLTSVLKQGVQNIGSWIDK